MNKKKHKQNTFPEIQMSNINQTMLYIVTRPYLLIDHLNLALYK